jgi:iron complex transport system substrate-binding protein
MDVIEDVERIGTALGAESRAKDLAGSLRSRIAAVRRRAAGRSRPRIACLEWLDPLYVGGHWVPEMVDIAGGLDVLSVPGRPSHQVSLEALGAAAPEVAVLMPCGFSVSRTVAELTAVCRTDRAFSRFLTSVPKTFAVDAAAYFSRPGPRLIDGLELMGEICSGNALHRSTDMIVDLTGNFCLTGISP